MQINIIYYPQEFRAKWKPDLLKFTEDEYLLLLEQHKKDAQAQECEVLIVDFVPHLYEQYLIDEQKEDTIENRANWAAKRMLN